MKYYKIVPYSHRQHYAMKKETENVPKHMIQAGSGFADALSKIGSVAGKIASNPAIQNLASAGLEVGSTVAGTMLANKLAQNPNMASNFSTALSSIEEIRKLYKSGEMSRQDALSMIKNIQSQSGSGAVKHLKSVAKKQHNRGHVMSSSTRPVRNQRSYDPVELNRSSGLSVPQSGGILPAIPIALVAGGIGLLSSILSPILERVSGKYIASKI